MGELLVIPSNSFYLIRHIKMDSAMIWNGQNSLSIAKETPERPKNFKFLKIFKWLKKCF